MVDIGTHINISLRERKTNLKRQDLEIDTVISYSILKTTEIISFPTHFFLTLDYITLS